MMTHNPELDALCEIARLFARGSGQRDLIEQALDLLETRLGMPRGAVMLVSAGGERLTVEAPGLIHAAGTADGSRDRRHQEIESRVLATGEPALIALSAEDRHGSAATAVASPALCVPVVMGHEVIGTLTAELPGGTPGALETGQKVLTALASLLAADMRGRRGAPAPEGGRPVLAGTMKQATHALERDMIVDALKRFGGNISAASRELGITGRMVRYKIKQFEIDYRSLFSRRTQNPRARINGSEAA